MGMLERLRRGWMWFARRLGQVQTGILLFVVYVLVIGPLAVALRVFGRRDLLEMRRSARPSFAHPKRQIPTDPERCQRQF
jgi:hypothetical protein